jgi:hypothetical protein
MRVSEKVSTAYGEGSVRLVVCDLCNKREAMISESTYDLNDGWFKMSQTDYSKDNNYPARKEQEFCSSECVVRHLAPGLLDQDPLVVQAAINSLKRIEQDLKADGQGN